MNFYAVCNVNGLIAAKLHATTLPDAKRELRTALKERHTVQWIDSQASDLEDDVGVNCDGMDFEEAQRAISDAGATRETDESTDFGGWEIWSAEGPMTAEDLQETVMAAILAAREEGDFDALSSVRSFGDAMVMTTDAGLVLTLKGGAEFQITIVRSK